MAHRLQYGFEFELVTGMTEKEFKKKLKSIFPEYAIRTTEDCVTRRSKKAIIITEDCSIKDTDTDRRAFSKKFNRKYVSWAGWDDDEHEVTCIEVVFPIMNERAAKNVLMKMDKHFFKTNECRMNKSCGLHTNVSFVSTNVAKKIDLPTLEINFDIDKWLKIFGRSRNEYCTRLINKTDVKKAYRKSDGDVYKLLKNLKNETEFKREKYRAINTSCFNEDTGRGRIEFRIPGGSKSMCSKRMCRFVDEVNRVMHDAVKGHSIKTTRRVNKILAA